MTIVEIPRRESFEITGLPAPQGSKTGIRMGDAVRIVEGKGAQRKRHKAWRLAVAQAAKDLTTHEDPAIRADQFTGPTLLSITFLMPRPKSRPKKHHGWHVIAPDLDKLLRSTLDGLTDGGLIADDKIVCAIAATKAETTGWTGAMVTLEEILEPTSINSSFPLAGRRLLDRLGITAGPTDTMLTSVATTTEIAAAQARYAATTAPTKAEGDRIIAAAAPFLTSTQLLTVTADGNGHAFVGAGGYTGSANVDYLAARTLQQHALGLAHSWLATGTASYADKLISRAMAWGVDPATKWDGAVPLPYTTPLTHLVTQTITQLHDAVAACWGYSGWTPAQRAGWRAYITGVVAAWQDHIAYAAPPSAQWPDGQIHNMEMTRVAFLLSCVPWLDGAAKTALVAKMADRYKAILTQNVRVVAGSPTQYRWRLEAVHPSGHTLGYHNLITNEAVSVLRRLENLGGGDLWAWSPGTTPAYSFLNVLDWLMTVLDRPTEEVTSHWLGLLPAMVLTDEWPAPIGALISKDWTGDTRRDLGFLHLVRAKYTSGARHTLAGSVLARNHAGTLDWHNRACGCARFIWGTV